jgi:YgiT-type zinc finger domain-containing protein
MKCVICKHGETEAGFVTVTLERNGCTIIFRGVPADVCGNCGEYYLSGSMTEELLTRAEASIKNGAEIEILRYAA